MVAMSSEDNMNSAVQLAETEIVAFGKVRQLFEKLRPNTNSTEPTEAQILGVLESCGSSSVSREEWISYIKLRATMKPTVAKLLMDTQFQAKSSQVRVRSTDFTVVAKLDRRFQ